MAATIKDIAKKTGLGLATISKYLNGGNVLPKNKALIDDAIRELSFTVNEFARGLKTSQSRTVGVVIPELNNTFITSILTYVTDILRGHDYAVIVCDCRTNTTLEAEMVRFLISKRVDGIINMPTTTDGSHLLPALEKGIPVVLVDRMIRQLTGQVSAVLVDNVDAAEKATDCLLDAGHRDIGIILGSEGVYTAEHRYAGYLNAFRRHKLTPPERLVFYSDYNMDGGYTTMKRLLAATPAPTAVFVTNYDMTLGAVIALNEAQIAIPDTISLIGFDKLDLLGVISPALTVVEQPQNVIGEYAAKLLLSLLGKEPQSETHQVLTLPTRLLPGHSVKIL